jgi:PAS domain S-box-containing protein
LDLEPDRLGGGDTGAGAADGVADARLLIDALHEHLAVALAAGELGTWRWDRTTGLIVWDPMMERIFGLEPGTFDGTFDAWVGLLHPDDVEETLARLDEAVATRQPYEVEHRVVWPDGSVHWLHGRGQVTVDEQGNVTGTIGCTSDVTRRKRLEAELARKANDAETAAARERLQRERLQFLMALNDAALRHDHRSIMRGVARAAVPRLGDWCAVYFLPEPGQPEVEMAHHNPSMLQWVKELRERFPYDPEARTGVPAVIRTGVMEFVDEIDEARIEAALAALPDPSVRDELRSAVAGLELTSLITVPLRADRGIIGAIQFVSGGSGRHYDRQDVSLAQAAARRVAQALDSAWLTEQHRMISATLQSALLPPRLPTIPGMSLAVRYWAAGAVSDVGGDFYDIFATDERRWSVAIGDVCGTGPNAAAVTAIARHTMRAAATHGGRHEEVLAWVNDALAAGHRDLFCTAIYATLEESGPGEWAFRFIAGGHPLPIVTRADGQTSVVGVPGTLLGVLPEVTATVTTVTLAPGDTVLLYTDGVTDVKPPHGLSPTRLGEALAGAAAGSRSSEQVAQRLGAAIQEILPIAERRDDIAYVVLRVPDD